MTEFGFKAVGPRDLGHETDARQPFADGACAAMVATMMKTGRADLVNLVTRQELLVDIDMGPIATFQIASLPEDVVVEVWGADGYVYHSHHIPAQIGPCSIRAQVPFGALPVTLRIKSVGWSSDRAWQDLP